MKPATIFLFWFARLTFCISLPFLVIMIMLFIFSSVEIINLFSGFFGLMWLALSLVSFLSAQYKQNRLNKLKESGICYQGTVDCLFISDLIRVGGYLTAGVECVYTDNKGNHCRVKSKTYYLLSRQNEFDDYIAKVYVDFDYKKKYAIELFIKEL